MALPGLVAERNLADVASRDAAWNNLGQGVVATISGVETSITIKADDILALTGVRDNSVADFVRIKGLTSLVQPRLTSAAQSAASGAFLRDNALLKASAVSDGDYFISRGTLDGESLQVNGLGVASISGSPFSGNTASVPLLISSFPVPTNFRALEPMTPGLLTAPERAIPVESEQFILFIKAGQS